MFNASKLSGFVAAFLARGRGVRLALVGVGMEKPRRKGLDRVETRRRRVRKGCILFSLPSFDNLATQV